MNIPGEHVRFVYLQRSRREFRFHEPFTPFEPSPMYCDELASRIQRLQPQANPRDVARLCLLLANYVDDTEELVDDQRLVEVWQEMGIRLQAATDQHAAMTEELETLAQNRPQEFSMEQIWTLIRAIRVQSQILQLYVGNAQVDV